MSRKPKTEIDLFEVMRTVIKEGERAQRKRLAALARESKPVVAMREKILAELRVLEAKPPAERNKAAFKNKVERLLARLNVLETKSQQAEAKVNVIATAPETVPIDESLQAALKEVETYPIEQHRDVAAAALQELERREDERRYKNLSEFAQAAWDLCNTQPLQWNWHHELICEWAQAIFERRVIPAALRRCYCSSCAKLSAPVGDQIVKRFIGNVPPRSSKSNLLTIDFPAWVWTKKPEASFVNATYEAGLSTDFSTKRRTLMESPWYQRIWPGKVEFSQDQNQKTQYRNVKMGEMIATSMGGAITGKGGNFLLIDDPVNPKQAFSDIERESSNRDFDSTFRSRLNNPAEDVIMIITQRTHEDDLTGHAITNGMPGEWTHISIPMAAERDEEWVFPISGRVVRRKKGELLQPNRWPTSWCEVEKVNQGPYVWAGQYQQRPAPLEGGIIKRDWIQYYRQRDLDVILTKREDACQSWDCAFKDTKTSAYVSGQVWLRTNVDFYLLARIHDHLDIIKTCNGIKRFAREYPWAVYKYVEDKANGPAVIQLLKDEVVGLYPVQVGATDGDKLARLHAVAPVFSSLHVWLPHPDECPWVIDVVNEWCTAPNAAYWDDTDAMTQALGKMKGRVYGLLGFLKGDTKIVEQIETGKSDAALAAAAVATPEIEASMEKSTTMTKVAIGTTTERCGACSSVCVIRTNGHLHCNACGHNANLDGTPMMAVAQQGQSRRDWLRK